MWRERESRKDGLRGRGSERVRERERERDRERNRNRLREGHANALVAVSFIHPVVAGLNHVIIRHYRYMDTL